MKAGLVILLGLGLWGCSSSEKKEAEVPIVVVDPDQPMMTPEEMARHFTNDRLVVLRGVMLTGIDRLIDWGDRFVVFDRRGQQVAVFDTTGNCIRQIKRLGKGPGEYIQVSDCTIDNPSCELVLYADTPGKLIYFDHDGNYLREEKMSDCFWEIVCDGKNMYGVNCSMGRLLAKQTIARIAKDKSAANEQLVPYDRDLPSVSAGKWLSTNGDGVWLSRAFDYTLYFLDGKSGRFVPRYRLDLGKATLSENQIKQDMDLMQLRKDGLVFHVPEVGEAGGYLFLRGVGRIGDSYMIDTVSGQMLKIGRVPLFGSSDFAVGGYGLLENQNKRIVHIIPVTALLMWSESMKNKGEADAQLEEMVAENEEFMNPILLFQNVI